MNDELFERIIEFKPETTKWVGGQRIPERFLNGLEKLYVEKVTCNGNAIVVSSIETMMPQGVLTMNSVNITEETLSFDDELHELPNLDIRIIGVKSRMRNIERNSKRFSVPKENIFIDEVHMGCEANAKRAWSFKTDKSHICVLNDDIEFSNNALTYISKMLQFFPDRIISILPPEFLEGERGYNVPMPKTPYILTPKVAGAAVIMPTELSKKLLKVWDDSIPGDDTQMINMIKRGEASPAITSLPSLIQHMGQQSIYNPIRVLGRTKHFRRNVESYDWDNNYLTSVHNLIR